MNAIQPIIIGDFVTLRNAQPPAGTDGTLYTQGYLRDVPEFKDLGDTSFVFAAANTDRPTASDVWRIVAADLHTHFGDRVHYGDEILLLNDYQSCGYLDVRGRLQDVAQLRAVAGYLVVETSARPRLRDGSSRWRVESAAKEPKKPGSEVEEGDDIRLVSCYPGGGHLVAAGAKKEIGSLRDRPGPGDRLIVTSTAAGTEKDAGTWTITRSTTTAPFTFDPAKMIPLRAAQYRKDDFVVALTGSVFLSADPYEVNFDTGSWTTSLPAGVIDRKKVTLLKEDVVDSWGMLSDKVQGDLSVTTADGTYLTAKNYVFFIRKTATNIDAPDDRGKPWGNAIMGGFPSTEPGTSLVPFPLAITERMDPKTGTTTAFTESKKGFGIWTGFDHTPDAQSTVGHAIEVEACFDREIESDWAKLRAYLKLGAPTTAEAHHLLWRHRDIPNAHPEVGFCPEMVPGFRISIDLDDPQRPGRKKSLESVDLKATIDTGAPHLTTRLTSADQHLAEEFASHFVAEGVWGGWNNKDYNADARSTVDAWVTVEYSDDDGVTSRWAFAPKKGGERPPTQAIIGRWAGNVPWPVAVGTPHDRCSLGNTVHFFCPAVQYDVENRRVGIAFR